MTRTAEHTSAVRRSPLFNYGWAASGTVVASLSVALTNIVLSREVVASELAPLLVAMSVVTVISMVARVGLDRVIVRFGTARLTEDDEASARRVVLDVIRTGTVLAALAATVVLVGLPVLSEDILSTAGLGAVRWPVALSVGFEAIRLIASEASRVVHDHRTATVVGDVMKRFLSTIAFAVGAVIADLDLVLAAWLWCFTSIATAVVALATIPRVLRGLGPATTADHTVGWRTQLTTGAPMMLALAAMLALLQVDLWVVSSFADDDVTAGYGLAKLVFFAASMPAAVLNLVARPQLVRLHALGDRDALEGVLRVGATVVTMLSLIALGTLAVAGEQILSVLFPSEYATGATALSILAIGSVLEASAGAGGLVLQLTGYERPLMVGILAVTTTAIMIEWFFGPDWGAEGVAACVAVALGAKAALEMVLAHRYTGLRCFPYLSPTKFVASLGHLRS